MKRKIFGIVVCIWMMASAVPAIGTMNDINEYANHKSAVQEYRSENWFEAKKLLASDGTEEDHFGHSVSLDADYAIIGAPWKGDDGGIYVFEHIGSDWNEVYNKDGHPDNQNFGYSVSIDGEYAIIGDPSLTVGTEPTAGGAKIAHPDETGEWAIVALIVASDYSLGDHFGWSVAIDGDYAAVGAVGDDDNGFTSGSIYILTRDSSGWYEQTKLLALDGQAYEYFGDSVSIDGDTVLIGARTNDNGEDSGAAYVFTRSGSTWTQQAKLLAPDGTLFDYFGYSVSLDGDTALIGAHGEYNNGHQAGAAYVFTRSGISWTQQAKLLPSDPTALDHFGWSVSLDGDRALIGTPCDDDNGETSGSAYVFTRSGTSWTQQVKLLPADGAMDDGFGCSVSLDGDRALIAAHGDGDNGDGSGSAYIFELNYPPATPTIDGPSNGKTGNSYTYNFSSTDPNQHQVEYYIEWGDGNSEGWYGPFDPGIQQSWSHMWTVKETYTIRCKSRDELGVESDWGELTVTMPCSYNVPLQWFWERFFQLFPNAFPLLRQLFGY